MTIKPSEQQQAIIDAVASGMRVACVLAYAGTGKSTTLKMIAQSSPEKTFLYVVYNKALQEDAVLTMPSNVEVRTGHSLAWVYVNSVYKKHGAVLSDRQNGKDDRYLIKSEDIARKFGIKPYDVIKTIHGENGSFEKSYTLTIHQTVRHVERAIEKFCSTEDSEIDINHFDKKFNYPVGVVDHAKAIWNDIKDIKDGQMRIGYAHMSKLWAMSNPDLSYSDKDYSKKYDVLMIDEAQDTNPVFGGIYRAQHGVQRVYVGDSYQAIYGYLGAGDELLKLGNVGMFPLTNSYRFGSTLAKKANHALEKLGADKQIIGLGSEPDDLFAADWDVVLCRTNAGVIKAIFKHLEDGKDVWIKKKYATELSSLLNTIAWFWGYVQDKPKKLHPDLEGYSSKVEIEEAIEDGDESQMVIEVLALLKSKGYKYLHGVLSEMNALAKKKKIEIITAHKSKGGEWDNVYIWSDFRGIKIDPRSGAEILPPREELMLGYVAVTRARKYLHAGSLEYIIREKEENR